jgi:hypothetical protein
VRRLKIFPILSSSVEVTFNTTTMDTLLAQKGDLVSASGKEVWCACPREAQREII